eukprot:EG_transcript_33161
MAPASVRRCSPGVAVPRGGGRWAVAAGAVLSLLLAGLLAAAGWQRLQLQPLSTRFAPGGILFHPRSPTSWDHPFTSRLSLTPALVPHPRPPQALPYHLHPQSALDVVRRLWAAVGFVAAATLASLAALAAAQRRPGPAPPAAAGPGLWAGPSPTPSPLRLRHPEHWHP